MQAMTHPWFMVVMLVIVVVHSWARLLFASLPWKRTRCLLIPWKLVLREEALTLRLCKNVVRKHTITYLPKISLWYLSLCLSIHMPFKWTFPILADNIPFKSQRPSNKTRNTSFEKAAFELLIRVVQERTKHGAFCYCLDYLKRWRVSFYCWRLQALQTQSPEAPELDLNFTFLYWLLFTLHIYVLSCTIEFYFICFTCRNFEWLELWQGSPSLSFRCMFVSSIQSCLFWN